MTSFIFSIDGKWNICASSKNITSRPQQAKRKRQTKKHTHTCSSSSTVDILIRRIILSILCDLSWWRENKDEKKKLKSTTWMWTTCSTNIGWTFPFSEKKKRISWTKKIEKKEPHELENVGRQSIDLHSANNLLDLWQYLLTMCLYQYFRISTHWHDYMI